MVQDVKPKGKRGRAPGFRLADDHKAAISESVSRSPAHQRANPSRSRVQIDQVVPYWIRAKRSDKSAAEVKAASPHAKRDDQLESMLDKRTCHLDGTRLTLTTTRAGEPEHGTARCTSESKSHTFAWVIKPGARMTVEPN